MSPEPRIERALPRILEDLGAGPKPDYADSIVIRTTSIRQRPGWFAAPWPAAVSSSGSSAGSSGVPWRIVGAIALLVLALTAGAVIVGNQSKRLPAMIGPAGNGLIAYSKVGDIYVGDPVTGTTKAIVVGPEDDRRPAFSPDGSRIAFVRRHQVSLDPPIGGYPIGGWNPIGVFDIVVVRPDGSDLTVITRERLVGVGLPAWTPDSVFVVVDLLLDTGPEWEWGYKAFDASRAAEPRDASDVLPAVMIGGGTAALERPDSNVLRSPTGDRVLFVMATPGQPSTLSVMGPDGADGKVLVDLADLGPGYDVLLQPMWSPDGSRIAFIAERVASPDPCDPARRSWPAPCVQSRVYLVNADGGDLRPLTRDVGSSAPGSFVSEEDLAWSPDGSKIVVDRRVSFDTGETRCCAVVVGDVETGVEIHATPDGYDGRDGNDNRSWSPDGRGLLVVDYVGDRVVMVDVETGQTTELPWKVGQAPSWQRVVAD